MNKDDVERKIRPYKTICRKCETPDDVKDMFKLASENINGTSHKKAPVVIGNGIENPQNFIEAPDNAAEQILNYQNNILGDEKCRCRRVNVMTYLIDKKKYKISKDEGVELMQALVKEYSEYPAVATLTESNGVLRIDHISSNLCEKGLRMTQVFKPFTVYNLYKDLKGRRDLI